MKDTVLDERQREIFFENRVTKVALEREKQSKQYDEAEKLKSKRKILNLRSYLS